MNADGSGRQLADPPPAWLAAAESNPAVSPDGTRTLYRDGVRLLLHTSDGSEDVEIAVGRPDPAICEQDPEACSPFNGFTSVHGGTWAPDGSAFAYWLKSGSCGELSCHELQSVWVANADGTDNLLRAWGLEPVWSPDSKLLPRVDERRSGQPEPLAVSARDGTAVHLVSESADAAFPELATACATQWSAEERLQERGPFCKAQRDFLGDAAFRSRYGTNRNGANANGKCVGEAHLSWERAHLLEAAAVAAPAQVLILDEALCDALLVEVVGLVGGTHQLLGGHEPLRRRHARVAM